MHTLQTGQASQFLNAMNESLTIEFQLFSVLSSLHGAMGDGLVLLLISEDVASVRNVSDGSGYRLPAAEHSLYSPSERHTNAMPLTSCFRSITMMLFRSPSRT